MQLVKEKKEIGRINVRLDASIKKRISKAAYILGQDITEFTVSTLNEKAREVIEKFDRFELSENRNDEEAGCEQPSERYLSNHDYSILAERR